MRSLAAVLTCLVTVGLADDTRAAQRYAAPGGSGTECSQGTPCTLEDAIGLAAEGDEVIVTAGAYTPTAPILTPKSLGAGIDVHGELGGPMPTIATSAFSPTIGLRGEKDRLSYLDVSNTYPELPVGVSCTQEGRVERISAFASTTFEPEPAAAVIQRDNCVVRNSLLRVEGPGSDALVALGNGSGSGLVAGNVTAIARGAGSTGIFATYASGIGKRPLELRNSIAIGEADDLRTNEGLEGDGEIVVSNSNFRAVSELAKKGAIADAGGNQTAAPLFVDAAAGDYREAAGSPTIDAGGGDQLGALDLAGIARALGPAPDIGAYEFVAPPAVPGEIQSLSLGPRSFRAVNGGGAILSSRKKARAPVGTKVAYSLSAAATVEFSVERKLSGRRAGKRCVARTRANKGKRKCPLFKPLRGAFTHPGASGANSFGFSGRLGGKALPVGSYRLTGKTAGSSKTANFKVVK